MSQLGIWREVEMVCVHSSGLEVHEGHFTLFHLLRHHWEWILVQLCWLPHAWQAKGSADTCGRCIGSLLLTCKEKIYLFAKYVRVLERSCYRTSWHTSNVISPNDIRVFSGERWSYKEDTHRGLRRPVFNCFVCHRHVL